MATAVLQSASALTKPAKLHHELLLCLHMTTPAPGMCGGMMRGEAGLETPPAPARNCCGMASCEGEQGCVRDGTSMYGYNDDQVTFLVFASQAGANNTAQQRSRSNCCCCGKYLCVHLSADQICRMESTDGDARM